jgi:hypothetical protein
MDGGDTDEDYRAASIPERVILVNNTFVGNPYAVTGGDNLIAVNNLFVGSSVIALKGVDGGSIAAHQLFWSNGADSEGSNLDLHTTAHADPLLDASFQLGESSPAIDSGTSHFEWAGEIVLDMPDEAYVGKAPDLGRYESEYTTSLALPHVLVSK